MKYFKFIVNGNDYYVGYIHGLLKGLGIERYVYKHQDEYGIFEIIATLDEIVKIMNTDLKGLDLREMK